MILQPKTRKGAQVYKKNSFFWLNKGMQQQQVNIKSGKQMKQEHYKQNKQRKL
jgi:hypothetical protein